MRNYLFSTLVSFTLMLVFSESAYSQSAREETEQRLRVLQDQITLDVVKISETQELEQASLQALQDLERKIAVREELINTNQQLVSQIERSRDSLMASLGELEDELDFHRKQYQKRAIHAYKYGRLHDVALILAARSINQMLIRVRYLNQFADQRRGRLEQILASTSAINERRVEIDENAKKAQELIGQYSTEQENLRQFRTQRNQMINSLKRQRTELQAELQKKQQEAEQLDRQIRQIITAESNKRASVPTNPVTDAANAELSSAFFASRSILRWPAEGAIIEPFGTVINPVYGTETYNPGVVISTTPSAPVSAIFDGEVNAIYTVPDFGRVITISHGDYTTMYGNLSLLYVDSGTPIKAGQLIGRSGTEAEPRGDALFFAIFESGTEVNPESWLKSR